MPPVVNPAALEKKLFAKSSTSCSVSYGETYRYGIVPNNMRRNRLA